MRPLIQATRDSVECTLNVLSGSLPEDWYGSVFINSPAGTVKSPLPFPTNAQEADSSVMNGDGYIWRFDLSPKQVFCKGSLLKPPCYFADDASKGSIWSFRNMGISRMSFLFGFRDEVNTAITPFNMIADSNAQNSAPNRFLACYDAGRPWEFDPETLRILAPVGMNTDWTAGIPPIPTPGKEGETSVVFPFNLVQSTAHPSYDPTTKEMFLVNFTKSLATMLHGEGLWSDIRRLTDEAIAALDGLAEQILKELYAFTPKEQILQNIPDVSIWLAERLQTASREEEKIVVKWYQSLFEHHEVLVARSNEAREVRNNGTKSNAASMGDEVILKRWNGKHGADSILDSWQIVDAEGNNLKIIQCMHQTSLTENFLVLSDSSFKFSLDLMMNFNSPFLSPLIKEFCRILLAVPQEPFLQVYIVPRPPQRASGDNSAPVSGKLVCYTLDKPIPLEAVHYSADYADNGNMITLHLAHNSAACLAEWVRSFDTLSYDSLKNVPANVVGLPSAGEMDIGRIGKCVISVDKQAQTATQQSFEVILEPGNLDDMPNIGKHTWGVGLYTYRNVVASNTVVEKIRHIFWSCYGFDPRLQTTFLEGLYLHYPNQHENIHDVQQIAKGGMPFVLERQNTQTMTIDDYFQFPKNVILKSVQFVPRKGNGQASGTELDPQLDGYIFTTVLVCKDGDYGTDYDCEVWIFKAWNLAEGTCCRLSNPQLDYAFTLHSTWVDGFQHLYNVPSDAGYSVEDDYNPILRDLLIDDIPVVGELAELKMQHFFRKYVYKPFNAPQ